MTLLVAGVLLFGLPHLMLSLAPKVRAGIAGKVGEGPFKGLFALTIIGGVVLIVFGWRSIDPALVFTAPGWGGNVTRVLAFVGIILFFAGPRSNFILRNVRNPQLTGVGIWAVGHLFSNGDQRALVLFGGLALWAFIEIIAVNRRDGAWKRPEVKSLGTNILPIGIGVIALVVLVFLHPYVSGVVLAVR